MVGSLFFASNKIKKFVPFYKVETMIEYSEYKSLVDILEKSENHENTYQEVMTKEPKVLDTINNVVNYYRDVDIKEKQFVNMNISYIVYRFFNVWSEIFKELVNTDPKKLDFLEIFTKDDRLIYIGVMLILISVFMYYVDITKAVKPAKQIQQNFSIPLTIPSIPTK